MRIAIAGAGGMGSRFGLYLKRDGNDVILIDRWQANIDAIRKYGMRAELNGKEVTEKMEIYLPEELDASKEKVDLIIALVKAPQMKGMFEALKPLIHEHTYVLCLMNGIGHEELLKQYVPYENILLGVTMWTAGMKGPGQPVLMGTGEVEIQNLDPKGEDFARKVVAIFDHAGLNTKYSTDVKYSIYRKACVNGVVNGLCSILDCNMYEYGQLPDSDLVTRKIVDEFADVAEKEGVHLDREEVFEHIKKSFSPDEVGMHYPSMYQDLIKNHRITEIDVINGAISRKGKAYGVATPYCDLITFLIHGKEKLLHAQ